MKEIKKRNPALGKIILDVAEIADYLWQNGWAEKNAGNISININDIVAENEFGDLTEFPVFDLKKKYSELSGKFFFVTGTGKRMRDLAKSPMKNALIIRISDNSKSYSMIFGQKSISHQPRPTSELPTHLGIHQMIAKRGTAERVVIHTHATELVALTQIPGLKSSEAINSILWGMHPETMVFVPEGVGFVPYILPGSEEIAKSTIDTLAKHNIVLWEKHGVFSIGENVLDTFDNIDIVCKSAKIYFLCRGAGFTPEGLSSEQLKGLKNLVF